jgi:hypothetical protein
MTTTAEGDAAKGAKLVPLENPLMQSVPEIN